MTTASTAARPGTAPLAPIAPLSPLLVLIMAMATGLAVASNYYPQPLLPTMADELGLSATQAGFIVTTAQLGYALGLLLIVPLGDLFERRGLIVTMTLLCAAGLLTTAFAPHFGVVLLGTALTGLLSVVAQLLVPFAATLATPDKRGKTVGTVMSGLLLGILLARTVAGSLAALGSWRTVYWVGAMAMVAMAAILYRALPRHHETAGLPYPRLLLSIATLFKEERVLRVRAVLGALTFANFSVLWTSMAFLLAAPPFRFSEGTIGLFGLAGAIGALAASAVGRLADHGKGEATTGIGLALLLLSWLPLAFAGQSLTAFIVGILALDLAVQGVHVSNQGAIYKIRPEARNRITAGYMTSNFIGAAAGSLASATAYSHAGWTGVVATGLAVSVLGFAAWAWARRRVA
ncbi:MFS transporter [Oryzomicrobium sp.]|uniref:MFS transporter n=1 Tax=Oryzomicrobium sp. TaxID=1911578 RepID=UPI002FE284D6